MDTKQISFNERPDTVTLYLIVDFNPRWSNTFFVQIRGVVNLQCALELHRGWILCWTWKVFSVPFTFFNLNEDFWIAPLLLVGPFSHLFYYFFLFCVFFFLPKVSRARFYKGTKPKSLRSFPVRPTVWSFGASLSASLLCFFCFCCWSISVCHLKVL